MTGDWVVFTGLVWVPLVLLVLSGWLWGPTVGDLLAQREAESDSMGVTAGQGDGEGS